MNYDEMTEEQLIALNQKLDDEKQKIQATKREITLALNRHAAARELAKKNPAEQKAIAQVISGAGGIASGERVVGPRAS